MWSRLVFADKAKWREDLEKGNSSLKVFLAIAEESSERETKKFVEVLVKVKKLYSRNIL